ncbi:MAG: glycosyltransferase [Elusimicrobia bacterium]|nr:glycosyltransferase [Elusimicrobiota bacterium]
MKKILLITFEYPTGKSYCGGVGQIVKQCRNILHDLGYEVYVLISSEFLKKYPVKVLYPDNSMIAYKNLQGFQKKHHWLMFDYIIQHFVNWTRELKKIKNKSGRRPTIIYHFHSILKREKDAGFKTLNHFLLNQEKMINLADSILCPSRYEYDNFIRYFPYFDDKVTLIENRVEIFPQMHHEIHNIKEKHSIKKDDIVSMYVGRLERIKGAHVLIKHLPYMLHKHKKLKLFIFGKVLERDIYRAYNKVKDDFPGQLYFMKYVPQHILFQYYYLSDIYINTSLSESFSLSTHESALCNNALLLNQLPVFEKFKKAALFFSCHRNNGSEFVERFEQLINDEILRTKLSQKASTISKPLLSNNRLKEELTAFLN